MNRCPARLPQRHQERRGSRCGAVDTREFGNSFISPLSDDGIPLKEISRVRGHRGTAVTEAVCLRQIRPVVQGGAGGDGPHSHR
jgi:hypothetical protein